MARKLTVGRKLVACLVMIALVTAWPANNVFAQAAPAASHADQPVMADRGPRNEPPAGFEAGRGGPASQQAASGKTGSSGQKSNVAPARTVYSQQVAGIILAQFDRTMGEIDAMSPNPSPTDVKNLTFRRRLLELRLLMDANTFMYSHNEFKPFRDTIDAAYQAIGDYQDVSVVEKLLDGFHVNDDIVNARRNQMNETVDTLRDPGWRDQFRAFFSDPRPDVRSSPSSPRLWDGAALRASNNHDAVGNAAMLGASILRHLQNQDLGVNDITDNDQRLYFHDVRKEMRSVIVLTTLYPDLANAVQDVTKPLQSFVDDYGNTEDAWVAWQIAQQEGMSVDDARAKLDHEFAQAQGEKDDLINSNGLGIMAERLEAVRDAHRVQ